MYEILENLKAVLTRPEIQYATQNFMRNVENVLKLWSQCLWRVNVQVSGGRIEEAERKKQAEEVKSVETENGNVCTSNRQKRQR